MGGQNQLEHRPADSVPAPAAAPFFGDSPEQVEAPFPIPGLSTAEPIRRSTKDPLGGAAVDPGTERQLRSPSGGSKLDDSVRRSMEQAFDTDFSDVRVHTDSGAAKLSQSMQATAFTHGSNIFFSQGSFTPGTDSGQHLLAHELTHVVQRKQGRDTGAAAGGTTIGKADDPLEAEADSVASDVVGTLRRQTKNCNCGQPH